LYYFATNHNGSSHAITATSRYLKIILEENVHESLPTLGGEAERFFCTTNSSAKGLDIA